MPWLLSDVGLCEQAKCASEACCLTWCCSQRSLQLHVVRCFQTESHTGWEHTNALHQTTINQLTQSGEEGLTAAKMECNGRKGKGVPSGINTPKCLPLIEGPLQPTAEDRSPSAIDLILPVFAWP